MRGSTKSWLVVAAVLGSVAAGCATAPLNDPVPAASPSAGVSQAQGLLYVCNQNDATVSIIDLSTNRIIRTVDLRTLGFSANAKPHHIVVEPDGSHWYVSLIGENRIVKLDRNDRVVGTAQFETPGMLSLYPAQDLLLVGRSMTAVNPPPRIGTVRRSTMAIEEIDVLFPRPHAIALDPSDGTAYTASLAVNQIAAIDLATERVELSQVSGPPHALMQFALSPDGRTLAISGELSGRLFFFDVSDRLKPRLVGEVTVEKQPFDPIFTPDGTQVWFGNKAANAVTVVDAVDRKVIEVIRGQGIVQPHGIAVSPNGRFVYVSNNNLKGTGDHADHMMVGGSEGAPAQPAGPGTIVVIDTQTRRIANVIEVGHNASGIALWARQ